MNLPFADRVLLAREHLAIAEERRGAITDSTVLAAAEAWTIDDLHTEDRDPRLPDYERLVMNLFALLTAETVDRL